jgi:hypothetical protein
MKEDVANEEQTNEEKAAAPGLSIGDLANLRQIIDVATKRGAFQANELEVVGNTYNRLNAFLGTIAANVQTDGENVETAEDNTQEASEE